MSAPSDIRLGQWTPYARDLYDFLVATFSNSQGGLADLETLNSASGLNSTEWEDLLQYTSQVLPTWNMDDNNLTCCPCRF